MSEPWIERWEQGRIGWHEARGNASLKRHWRSSGRRVLVPLCGKSLDLLWLAERGNEVVGVELSALAAMAFFTENRIAFRIEDGPMPAYRAVDLPLSIVCGDFLAFRGGPFDACFDRGALVALPPAARPAYVAQLDALLTADAEILLVTLEYEQHKVAGPPYSVPAAEVRRYWPALRCADSHDDLANAPPKFRAAGLEEFCERVWQSP